MGANELSDEAERRAGAVLKGKWRLGRVIGIGGTATVYEAWHRNGSRVAVKIMHRGVAHSLGQRKRFFMEGNAANRVNHPGVTVVYDDDEVDGTPFLVMELLEGSTVADRAAERGGTLPPLEVLDIGERLLDVLVAAHAQGVIHRDIKPQNLFLTDAGVLKVLDFGIARMQESPAGVTSTETGTVLGTPAFLPPEQARGRPDQIDARSDLWAVGATLFTLLTGRYVHEAPSRAEQLGLAMMATAPSLGTVSPSLPKALVAVVDRALAYSREQRWPDARAMLLAVRWLRENWEDLQIPGALPECIALPTKSDAPTVSDRTLSYAEPANARLSWYWALPLAAMGLAAVAWAIATRHAVSPHTGAPAPSVEHSAPSDESPPLQVDGREYPNIERAVAPLPSAPLEPASSGLLAPHRRSKPAGVVPRPSSAEVSAVAPMVSTGAPAPPVQVERPDPASDPMNRRH